MERSSSGRPSIDIGMPPSPIALTCLVPMVRCCTVPPELVPSGASAPDLVVHTRKDPPAPAQPVERPLLVGSQPSRGHSVPGPTRPLDTPGRPTLASRPSRGDELWPLDARAGRTAYRGAR